MPTAANDLPEFCEINLRLSSTDFPVLSHPPSAPSLNETSPSFDGSSTGPTTYSLQIPRQTVGLVHIRDRTVTVYLYNWMREDADRLIHRVETLVSWYNQRFQLLSCISMQKMGLFHCLRTPSHLSILKRAAQLGEQVSPPEFALPVSSATGGGGSAGPPSGVSTPPHSSSTGVVSSTPASLPTMRIRRRFVEVLVGGGSEAHHINTPTLSNTMWSPGTPSGDILLQYQHSQQIKMSETDLNLTRIYQNCAQVPPLLQPEAGGNVPVDLVHLHVAQAMCAVRNDVIRAHQLQLITAPLKAWMGGDGVPAETSSVSTDPLHPSVMDLRVGLAPSVFYSAVKRFGRTLHTVCSPILFCPRARAEAMRFREAERRMESDYPKLALEEAHSEPSKDAHDNEGKTLPDVNVAASSALGFPSDEASPAMDPLKKTTPLNRKTVVGPESTTPCPPNQESPNRKPGSQRRRSLRRASKAELSPRPTCVEPSLPRENSAWMQEAGNALLLEFIAYMTQQMHFSVIRSSVDKGCASDGTKFSHPYALLQRSVRRSGIHLIEVFIRSSLFCVRLKAVELCRFTRAASRGVLTGPLAADQVGRAAAVAAVKITSAMIAAAAAAAAASASSSTTITTATDVGLRQVSAAPIPSLSPPSNAPEDSSNVSPSSKAYVIKWEESSRLCDCVHLHSFLYDFYLRNVDIFLKKQSNMMGQRMPSANVTWALSQPQKHQRGFHRPSVTTAPSVERHSFLPTNYQIIGFLRDLSVISPQAPVFSRGTFHRLRMSLPVDSRIKPEQVFEHLIEERQAYGFKAFDLGVGSGLPVCNRFGFCNFTSPRMPPPTVGTTITSDGQWRFAGNRKLPHRTPIGANRHRTHSDAVVSQTSTVSFYDYPDRISSTDSDDSNTSGSDAELCNVGEVEEEDMEELKVGDGKILTRMARRKFSTNAFFPRISLPVLKHFSVTCAGFLESRVNDDDPDMSPVEMRRTMELSIFVILTDHCKRFPRARLSSLPDGLSSEHQSPVQWPAIRPGLSSEEDLNFLSRKIVRSGSHETEAAATAVKNDAPGKRCRHTSLMATETVDTSLQPSGRGLFSKTNANNSATLEHLSDRTGIKGDPGLRWKISYLGVWPSHQIELGRALKLVRQTWFVGMHHVINSAMLVCHKNLLWYRLFDPQYLPQVPGGDDFEEAKDANDLPCLESFNRDSSPEIGIDASTLGEVTTGNFPSRVGGEFNHGGLSCEEFQDLSNSAPLQLDLLLLDPRLNELLKISGKHLAFSVIRRINSIWNVDPSSRGSDAKAFLFDNDDVNGGWVHLGLILPFYREGFIHIFWRREKIEQETVEDTLPPQTVSRFNAFLRSVLTVRGGPIEGIPVDNLTEPPGSACWSLSDFGMRAVFRSANSLDVSQRSVAGASVVSSQITNFYRTPLMNTLKFLVEILTYHVWEDLHLGKS